MFNLINKYKQSNSLISHGFNYSYFVYSFFSYHVKSFPYVFNSVKSRLELMVCRFESALILLDRYIRSLYLYITRIEKKLETIKCCIEKMRSCILCYVGELNSKITCYVENLIMTIICAVPQCQENGAGGRLHISLKLCKLELISSLLSKAKCLNLFQPKKGLLNQIQCQLKEICTSISTYISEMYKLKNSLHCSKSIKSQMDTFKCHLNKYIYSLTYINCLIKEIIGMECLKNLNTIICEMWNFECFAKLLIEQFKSSVVVIIKLIGKNISCNIERVIVDVKCQIPDLCTIKKELSGLTCLLRNHICYIRNIICCMKNSKSIITQRKNHLEKIKYELEKIESSINMVNFFKCSNKAITENTIDLAKRLLGIGKQISNDGLTKSSLYNQGLINHDREGYEGSWTVLSHMFMMEPTLITSLVYEFHEKKEKLEEILNEARCYCATYFNCEDKTSFMKEIWNHHVIAKTLNEYKKDDIINDDQNRICICLVITYHIYPRFMKCYSLLFNIIRDLSSTSMRNFENQSKSYTFNLYEPKVALFFIQVIANLLVVINEKYLTHFLINPYGWFHCYCISPKDSKYEFFITTMIYVSSLVENIFENETTGDSIQSLSALKAEMENVKFDKQPGGSSSCSVYSTSVCINVSNFQVNHTLFYKDNKCKINFKQIEVPCLYAKICCCKIAGGETQNNCSCQRTKGSCTCCCCTANGTGACTNCSCDGSVNSTWEFIVDEGVSKKVHKFSKSLAIPNFWCLCKLACVLKNGETCREVEKNVLKLLQLNLFWSFKTLSVKLFKLMPWQILNTAIFYFMSKMNPNDVEIIRKLTYMLKNENIVRTTREIRIVDSTSVISNNKLEGASNNHYSYNDAYRINTSRAHGSLKYIIIKIVLILIIVVMTIFHPRYELISRHKKVNCSILQFFQPGFQKESFFNHISK